jgi:hypothetical protein
MGDGGVTEHSGETLSRDIRNLAQALLDHPEFGPIIRDAGTHSEFDDWDLSTYDWDAPPNRENVTFKIWEFSRTSMFFHSILGSHWPHDYINAYLAIAVARRVAQGDFANVDDPRAQKMIAEQKSVMGDHTNRDRKIPYSDFLAMFLEFAQTPGLNEVFEAIRPILDENGGSGNFDLGEVNSALHPIQWAAVRVMHRYGFMYNHVIMWSMWCRMKEQGLNPLDENEIMRRVTARFSDLIDIEA